jgi:hypothetical protein
MGSERTYSAAFGSAAFAICFSAVSRISIASSSVASPEAALPNENKLRTIHLATPNLNKQIGGGAPL